MPTKLTGGHQDERFARLTEEYYTRVRALVSRFAHSEEDRDELTQEAFLAIYKGLGGFRGEASLGTWVYRVTWNTCVTCATRARAEARRRQEPPRFAEGDDPVEDSLQLLAVTPAGQFEAACANERSHALHQAVAKLPREMRRVVLLRLQDRKYQEIATALQLSEETVKKQLSLARARLRDLLGEAFRDEDV